jgi:hypothetical protein
VQGLGIAGFGVIADHVGAPRAIGLAGAVAALLAVLLGVAWERARQTTASVDEHLHPPAASADL